MSRLGCSVGSVDDPHEVRRGGRQPELDGEIVQCFDADAVRVLVSAQVVVLRLLKDEVDRY